MPQAVLKVDVGMGVATLLQRRRGTPNNSLNSTANPCILLALLVKNCIICHLAHDGIISGL
jgi:hypothetical protein